MDLYRYMIESYPNDDYIRSFSFNTDCLPPSLDRITFDKNKVKAMNKVMFKLLGFASVVTGVSMEKIKFKDIEDWILKENFEKMKAIQEVIK